MPVTKETLAGKDKGGAASAAPTPEGKGGKRVGAKTKVRILMPDAFEARGIRTWKTEKRKIGDREYDFEPQGGQLEVVEIDEKLAADLIAAGHAEKL